MNKCLQTLLILCCIVLPPSILAQVDTGLVIETPNGGWVEYDLQGNAVATNGVIVKFGGAVLTADRMRANTKLLEVSAEGRVRIQRDDMIWAGEQIKYNFKTRTMQAALFRTGKSPVFAEASGLEGSGGTNGVYTARQATITTDDVAKPYTKVRASSITIYSGKRLVARNATLYVGGLPVFYFPYYTQNLDQDSNQFFVTPGYRSRYGGYLLGGYRWWLNDHLDGTLHLDYRLERGVGAGPELNFDLGRWGQGQLDYYYLSDLKPGTNAAGFSIPDNRQRFHFGYEASPWTNTYLKTQVRYQSDELLLRDFFESEYRANPQPSTYVEFNHLWDDFSLDLYAQPRVNDFFGTSEHLPDLRFTGFRQQVGRLPIYYESESSLGSYRRRFAETNGVPSGIDFEAARGDSYHHLVSPHTLFGWLNFIPRIGGRVGYYGSAYGAGAGTGEEYRGVLNTGAELNFKASRLWPDTESYLFDVHGLRHIVQPSINYVYVPRPSVPASRLPQFSYPTPSLRLLPIDYPDYNAIDAIDTQNVIRFGLANKLQTKREGQVEDLLRWDLYTDWRLRPRTGQSTFADLWSDLLLRPRNWLVLESQTRIDLDTGDCRMALHNLTLQPNDKWSWSFGHWYLRGNFDGLGPGNDLITSTAFYRLNENWALRTDHHYEIQLGRLQEQYYTVYRDFRNWTGAVTFRVRDNGLRQDDYTLAFTLSLKAAPRYKLGADTLQPYELIGN